MRLPRTALIATGFILPLFALSLIVATQLATHAKTQHHVSLKPTTITSQVKGTSTAQVTSQPTTTQIAQTMDAAASNTQQNATPQTPTTSTPNATSSSISTPLTSLVQSSNSVQPNSEQIVTITIPYVVSSTYHDVWVPDPGAGTNYYIGQCSQTYSDGSIKTWNVGTPAYIWPAPDPNGNAGTVCNGASQQN